MPHARFYIKSNAARMHERTHRTCVRVCFKLCCPSPTIPKSIRLTFPTGRSHVCPSMFVCVCASACAVKACRPQITPVVCSRARAVIETERIWRRRRACKSHRAAYYARPTQNSYVSITSHAAVHECCSYARYSHTHGTHL